MGTYSTSTIEENLYDCADLDELKEKVLPLLQGQRFAWAEKMEQIMTQNHYTNNQLAELCRVSAPAVRKWRGGALPQRRDMYIRIGFAAGYGLEEMNTFLQRYGKCPKLYVKSLEDSVCIFVLRSEYLPHTYETYLEVLDMVRRQIQENTITSREAYPTLELSEYFARLTRLEEMVAFAQTHAPSYRQAYARLYSYIIAYLHVNLQSEYLADGDGSGSSFHALATESRWSSSLRHCISEIRSKRWFPLRHKVISLGLHLNMDTDAINRMLQYAQMEPLCPKSPAEASIIWAVNEARLCSENDEIIPDGSSELCESVKKVLMELDLSEECSYLFDDL